MQILTKKQNLKQNPKHGYPTMTMINRRVYCIIMTSHLHPATQCVLCSAPKI
jgi:hypothetical protein